MFNLQVNITMRYHLRFEYRCEPHFLRLPYALRRHDKRAEKQRSTRLAMREYWQQVEQEKLELAAIEAEFAKFDVLCEQYFRGGIFEQEIEQQVEYDEDYSQFAQQA